MWDSDYECGLLRSKLTNERDAHKQTAARLAAAEELLRDCAAVLFGLDNSTDDLLGRVMLLLSACDDDDGTDRERSQ